jgi:transposase
MVLDGAINGKYFLAYVEQVLLPTLREGDIVVMDNLSSHKNAGVAEAILSVGAKVLYLPLYSPAMKTKLQSNRDGVFEIEDIGTQV